MADTPKNVPRVVISIKGGVADILYKPMGLELHIIDYDVQDEDAGEKHVSRDHDGYLCQHWIEPIVESIESRMHRHWPLLATSARKVFAARSNPRWQCPVCQRITAVSVLSLAEVGTPYCADCDKTMELLDQK